MLVESYEIEEIARLIERHRPTTMFGSDDMYARLLELVPGERPFPSIKWAGYGRLQRLARAICPSGPRRAAFACAGSTA